MSLLKVFVKYYSDQDINFSLMKIFGIYYINNQDKSGYILFYNGCAENIGAQKTRNESGERELSQN